MCIQTKINEALNYGEATYQIAKNNKKFVLTVKDGSALIGHLDNLFNSGQLSLVPNAIPKGGIPVIKIDKYVISPAVSIPEKHVRDGEHIYNFDYVEHKNS